jgi:hypothetical protein
MKKVVHINVQITHQAMWNIMMSSHKHFGMFSEEDVNEMCRELQAGWNAGENTSSDAVFAKALRRKSSAKLQLEATSANSAPHSVLRQQQPNQIQSAHAEVQQPKDACKGVMQAPAVKAGRKTEHAGAMLDARLMAIRRAHEEADDGNTRTRL